MAQSNHPRCLSYQGVHLMVDPNAPVSRALGGHQGEPVVLVVLCGREQRRGLPRPRNPADLEPRSARPHPTARQRWQRRPTGPARPLRRTGSHRPRSPRSASCRHSRKHRSCSSPIPPAARRRRVTNAAAVEISVLMAARAGARLPAAAAAPARC